MSVPPSALMMPPVEPTIGEFSVSVFPASTCQNCVVPPEAIAVLPMDAAAAMSSTPAAVSVTCSRPFAP